MSQFIRIGCMAVAACALLLLPARIANAEVSLNLLFFGNSFTIGSGPYNVAMAVGEIAVADGHPKPAVADNLSGGKNLIYHVEQIAKNPQNNITNSVLPANNTWNYVVIQGYSTESTFLDTNSSDYASIFSANAKALYESVLNHHSGNGAGAVAVLFQTWARHPNNTRFYPEKFSDAYAMQSQINESYSAAAHAINAIHGAGSATVAPVGDGFVACGLNVSYYKHDLYHASQKGYRLASLIIYRTIYRENVSDISYSSVSSWIDISQESWLEITRIADSLTINHAPANRQP